MLLADLLDPPDLAEARGWWTRAAEAGHTDAQYSLGRLLADLLDPPDLAGARGWWTRAAEAGHTDAQYSLGRLLADLLDPPDLAGARGWWTRAAEAGHTDAQYSLGRLLADLLDPPDLAGARAWWTRATMARCIGGLVYSDSSGPVDYYIWVKGHKTTSGSTRPDGTQATASSCTVLDSSIIYERLLSWADEAGEGLSGCMARTSRSTAGQRRPGRWLNGARGRPARSRPGECPLG